MPLVTIWQNNKIVANWKAIQIRNETHKAVVIGLKVKPKEVEVRIRNIGILDINCAAVGIEIDTGPGEKSWRTEERLKLTKFVAEEVNKANILSEEWLGPNGCYVWMRICQSAFVPIGFSEHAR